MTSTTTSTVAATTAAEPAATPDVVVATANAAKLAPGTTTAATFATAAVSNLLNEGLFRGRTN